MYKKSQKADLKVVVGRGRGGLSPYGQPDSKISFFWRHPQIDDEMTWIDCFLRMPIFVYNFGNFLQEGALASLSTSSQRLKIRIQH